jgi:hypothetical protein
MLDRITTAHAAITDHVAAIAETARHHLTAAAAALWDGGALPIIDMCATIATLPLPVALPTVALALAAASAVCERTNH